MPLISCAKKAPKNKRVRAKLAIIGQKLKHRACPQLSRLDGKRILITGGNAGVGEFITRSLIAQGAQVTSLARGVSASSNEIPGVEFFYVDLTHPESIVSAVNQLGQQPFDIVICNAGLLSKTAEMSPSGYEKTFAVNVLGHHILYRLLMKKNLLVDGARIVITTGDIYILESECSPEIPFDEPYKTYSRSKLGNLWQVRELTKRYPNLHPIAVHPGVIANNFAGERFGLLSWLRRTQLISEEQGAHSSLIGATQNLPRGSYWHNVFGLVDLSKNDPACHDKSSQNLWGKLESITLPYLQDL